MFLNYFVVIFSLCFVSLTNCALNSVSNVDLMINNNSRLHETYMFYQNRNPPQCLIIRRSASFRIKINLISPLKRTDRLQLHFQFFANLGYGRTQSYDVHLPSEKKSHNWKAKFIKNRESSKTVEVEITLPVKVPVGFWTLNIYTYDGKALTPYNHYVVYDILILFNPWSPADAVYMKDKEAIDEYILNERGYILTGNFHLRRSSRWLYSQFKPSTIEAYKIILDRMNLTATERADPVIFSRRLTAINNGNDYDSGIMAGKWEKPYNKFGPFSARNPLSWTGSAEILEEFLRNNGRTVAYAQCWVFSSILTTLFRAIGIPARTITTYESGHDFDGNATIHYVLNYKGNIIRNESESIWNFHVWNEIWMKRFDLSREGLKYGGWQIVDSTPQNPSENRYQMGPAPLKAVREAKVTVPYDSAFAYAEVNADVIYRNVYGDLLSIDESRVGKYVTTKGMGRYSNKLIDITSTYKEKENTKSERQSFQRAIAEIYGISEVNARSFRKIKIPPQHIGVKSNSSNHQFIGDVVDFYIIVTNDFPKQRTFEVFVTAYSVYYTGKRANDLFHKTYTIKLNAYTESRVTVQINPKDYVYKLVPFSIIKTELIIRTVETGRILRKTYELIFEKPELKIVTHGKAIVGKPFYIDIHLKNPLKVQLTNCVYAIQGLRLNANLHRVANIASNANNVQRFALKFTEAIEETVAIVFLSYELDQVVGDFNVKVHNN